MVALIIIIIQIMFYYTIFTKINQKIIKYMW